MQIDVDYISRHKQIAEKSCVPMSVECVLKLLRLMPINDFSLQMDGSKSGQSNWIKDGFNYQNSNQTVKFERQFLLEDIGLFENRGSLFMESYFENLFITIDNELVNDRYVIISLESAPNQWHMEVIYNKNDNNLYQTISFYYNDNYRVYNNKDLRHIVAKMQGTDILTYSVM